MTRELRKRNYQRLKNHLETQDYTLVLAQDEGATGNRVQRVNERSRRLTAALRERETIESWFPKAYFLGKELRGEALGDTNRHKRMAKKLYQVFRGREPWIPINKEWRAKHFEEIIQSEIMKLNAIWISTELEDDFGGDLWT